MVHAYMVTTMDSHLLWPIGFLTTYVWNVYADATCIKGFFFLAITHYLSFFNYGITDQIATELGAGEHKQELQECVRLSETDHADVFVKVDSPYKSYTVGELEGFQNRLCGILHISSQSALNVCRAEEGCLQLMFQVPSFAHQKIFPLSSQQERALTAERVIKLTCGNYEFVAKVCAALKSWIASSHMCTVYSIAFVFLPIQGKESKSEPEDTGKWCN